MADLQGVPSPPGAESYWPYVLLSLSLVVNVGGALWAAWFSVRQKRIDAQIELDRGVVQSRLEHEKSAADSKMQMQMAHLQAEFERQKDFQQDVLDEGKALREECRALREDVKRMAASVQERDATIHGRDKEIADLRREIAKYQAEVARLEERVRVLEGAVSG